MQEKGNIFNGFKLILKTFKLEDEDYWEHKIKLDFFSRTLKQTDIPESFILLSFHQES